MSKVWSYVVAFLSGALLVAIICMKWFTGQDISVEVKKIKNKKTSGTNTTTIPISIVPDTKPKKEVRQEIRATKKEARTIKKEERKAKKQ